MASDVSFILFLLRDHLVKTRSMLVFALIKGVPANTANVVTVGGVLKREEMDIVLNPYDKKTVEAADYFRRVVGGKLVAVSMGPHPKIIPIMNELFGFDVEGIDEAYILSDRRMAGADTLATAYTLALGIKKILDEHRGAIKEIRTIIESGANQEEIKRVAESLYSKNLIPNSIYSNKAVVKDHLLGLLFRNEIGRDEAVNRLLQFEKSVYENFIVFAGMKASDGETGNVGPQVAEALSEILGVTVPHVTFVLDYEILDAEGFNGVLIAKRKLIDYFQVVRLKLPAVLTIHPEYKPGVLPLTGRREARMRSYKGKLRDIKIWNADDIGAEYSRIGLAGSPTIVGPGVDIGKPLVKKVVGTTLIATKDVDSVEVNGKRYGPFRKGDVLDSVPPEVRKALLSNGAAKVFDYDDLAEELVRELTS